VTAVNPVANPGAPRQAVVQAALLVLEQMGLSAADLTAVPRDRATVPTFAEYVPVVSAAVTAGTRRAYGSYWNRVVEHWGGRRLDEPTPSEIRPHCPLAEAARHHGASQAFPGGFSRIAAPPPCDGIWVVLQ
jgi:integrase/recombinase XerC